MAFAVKVDIALIDKISSQLGRVDRAFIKTANVAQKSSDKIRKSLNRVTGSIDKVANRARNMGAAFSVGTTLPIAAFTASSVKAAATMESLKLGLKAVTGSADEAESQFKDLLEVAKLPGLGIEDAVRGATQLQAAGFSADEAKNSLLAFGNALASVGKGKADLQGVNLALTQLVQKDSGFGQDLRQLVERLPQVRGALKAAFGVGSTDAINELGLTGREVVNGLIQEFSKLDKVDSGLNNAIENIGDAFFIFKADIGEVLNKVFSLEAAAEKLGNFLRNVAERFKNLSPAMQKIVIVSTAIAAIAPVIVTAIGLLGAAVAGIVAGGAPLAIIAAVSASIAGIVSVIAANWNKVKGAIVPLAKFFAERILVAVRRLLVSLKTLMPLVKFLAKVLGFALVGALFIVVEVLNLITSLFLKVIELAASLSEFLGLDVKLLKDIAAESKALSAGAKSGEITQQMNGLFQPTNVSQNNIENVINNEDGKTKSTETRVNGVIVAAKTINRGSLMPSSVFS